MANNELKPLVVVVSFLALFTILVVMIPGEFYAESSERREIDVPEYFDAIDIYSFAETWVYQMNETFGAPFVLDGSLYLVDVNSADFGGWHLALLYSRANQTHHGVELIHIHYEWYIFPADHSLTFKNRNGLDRGLSVTDVEMTDDTENGLSTYTATCDHMTIHVSFGYNSTIYDNFTDAWDYHDLYVFLGISFADASTKANAWNLISSILFFQMPDVHILINTIIAIPLWISIAYLIYVLILKAIPLVG